ncbi:hypothetical protein EZV62_000775 [Acer yangbiense]|uniref:PGG domain-containing protein n=1 Tax=Acer yangbiense TaxID=1000413 RepID=A0A5C7IUR0_9ROSI|nr:hypothetical protein EZV62_000775 [Acer yangbiense]
MENRPEMDPVTLLEPLDHPQEESIKSSKGEITGFGTFSKAEITGGLQGQGNGYGNGGVYPGGLQGQGNRYGSGTSFQAHVGQFNTGFQPSQIKETRQPCIDSTPIDIIIVPDHHPLLDDAADDCYELVDDKGWNVLHFAMTSFNRGKLFILVENPLIKKLIHEKDVKGNTPFHVLATVTPYYFSYTFLRIINKFEGDITAVNNNNVSVCNVLNLGYPELQQEILKLEESVGPYQYGVVRVNKGFGVNEERQKEIEKTKESHLIVAALIATVTFTAAFTLPGGVIQDGDKEGTAILSKKAAFQAFVITDAIALVLSLSAVFAHFLMSLPGGAITLTISLPCLTISTKQSAFLVNYGARSTMMAMGAMVIAFVTGTYAVLTTSLWLAILTTFIGLSFFLFMYLIWTAGNGKASVVDKLISKFPCCELVDNKGCNALHLALASENSQNGQSCPEKSVAWKPCKSKDEKGNTPLLQLAASSSFIRSFISHPRVDKLAFNRDNQNAADIILAKRLIVESQPHGPVPANYRLRKENAEAKDECDEIRTENVEAKDERDEIRTENVEAKDEFDEFINKIKEAQQTHLVAATLIATVTFAAGFTLPGGFIGEDGLNEGAAILTRSVAFKAFVIFNTTAFVLSCLAVLIHLTIALNKDSIYAVLYPDKNLAIAACVIGCVFGGVQLFLLADSLENMLKSWNMLKKKK